MWEEPEGYKEINYSLLMMMAKNAKSELWASLLVQKTWRAKKARGDVRSKRGEQSGQTSGWEAIEDPGSGEFYYCPSPLPLQKTSCVLCAVNTVGSIVSEYEPVKPFGSSAS